MRRPEEQAHSPNKVTNYTDARKVLKDYEKMYGEPCPAELIIEHDGMGGNRLRTPEEIRAVVKIENKREQTKSEILAALEEQRRAS